MAAISLRHIRKAYPGGFTAVHDFSLEIPDQEFVILVGPSGCGKSTVLRMIAGLEDISGGELYIGGRLVNEEPPRERNIAMVFQNYALYPHMTIYQNMAFGLTLRDMPEQAIDKRVREAAAVLGIESLLERKPKALSGGQRQRVALGRAMVREPAVFLLDEPLSNLDAKLRTQMRAEISKLHKRLGTTFVYVTHDQTEAMTMGDRIVVMKDGRVRQEGSPQHLYDSPDNMFVAGFIGSPQMNMLPVRLQQRGSHVVALCGDSVIFIPPGKGDPDVLAGYFDKDCVLGVRPENFTVVSNPSPDGHDHLEGIVELAERTGAETYLYLTVYGVNLIARVPPLSVHFGDRIRLTPIPERLHLFDAETGAVIFN